MPRANRACASLPAVIEPPVMTGTIAALTEPPTSRPPSRARSRNSRARWLSRRTRSGSRSRMSIAASAAAAAGGAMPTENTKPGGGPLQFFDKVPAPGDMPAAGNQGLAQRAHPDIDLARVDAGQVGRPETARAEHAKSMRLVDHKPGATPSRHGDKGGDVGHVTVHAVMALDDEQGVAVTRARVGQ